MDQICYLTLENIAINLSRVCMLLERNYVMMWHRAIISFKFAVMYQTFFSRRGSFGMLPLHMASLGGFTDCCRKLISYGKYQAYMYVGK